MKQETDTVALTAREERLWRAQDASRGQNGRIWSTLDAARTMLHDAEERAAQPDRRLIAVLEIVKRHDSGPWMEEVFQVASNYCRDRGATHWLGPLLSICPAFVKDIREAIKVLESDNVLFENNVLPMLVAQATDLVNTFCREHGAVAIGQHHDLIKGIESLAFRVGAIRRKEQGERTLLIRALAKRGCEKDKEHPCGCCSSCVAQNQLDTWGGAT